MSIVSVMVQYLCPVFNMLFEYPELLLLFLIACTCSLYLVWSALPVCPMYFSGQCIVLYCIVFIQHSQHP
jgi:hypothetical protein